MVVFAKNVSKKHVEINQIEMHKENEHIQAFANKRRGS